MKCEDVAEFVSALCDGETIPRAAAEHIGRCEVCRGRLREYTEIAAELRRVASLELPEEAGVHPWEKVERAKPSLWRRGWETMRIPRFVLVVLLITVVVLGSGLIIVKARARNQQTILMLTATPPSGHTMLCTLPIVSGRYCKFSLHERSFAFRLVSEEGDRILLGVRIGPTPPIAVLNDIDPDTFLNDQKEAQYWLEPGKQLEIAVPGDGTMTVTGKLMDEIPPLSLLTDELLEPRLEELRFASPVLLRDNKLVLDLEGHSATVSDTSDAIEFYAPGDGLYRISLAPSEGAVRGDVKLGRVSFELDGHDYKFLLAAPVTGAEHVWILRDENYKPPSGLNVPFLGTGKLPI